MKATAKHKVVTSGRLTKGVKVQLTRRQMTPYLGPSASPAPAYSLYSTDSEDQVTTLHKGLDHCAALLNGILQADKAASPSLPKAAKGGAAKSRPSTSVGKNTTKELPRKTVQKNSRTCLRGQGSTTPRTTHQSTPPAAHSGVKLHPPQKQPHTAQQPHLPPSCSQKLPYFSPTVPPLQSQTSTPPAQPQTSVLLSVLQSSSQPGQPPPRQTGCLSASQAPHTHNAAFDREEEEELVPVRDVNSESTATDRHAFSQVHACAAKMSNVHLEPGQVDKIPQDAHSRDNHCAGTEEKAKTVRYLLGELKALIAGQGSVAERLLSHLERMVSSPLAHASGSNVQTGDTDPSSPPSQNIQLSSQVKILNQKLKEKEKAERRQSMETLCNSQVMILQEELTAAQTQLRELQDDLTELRKALQDTQSQLRSTEAENAVIKTDLEATRNRLMDTEQEKSELAALAQQRLEEIEKLNRMLQSRDSSDCPTVVDSSISDAWTPTKQRQQGQHLVEPPAERVTQYLMSLGQLDLTLEQERMTSVHLRDTLSHKPAEASARHHNSHLDQSRRSDEVQSVRQQLEKECGRPLNSTLSQCDVESVRSDWSMRSGSTFDTRDEAAFRVGLAALDASIASLQKTIQLDLRR